MTNKYKVQMVQFFRLWDDLFLIQKREKAERMRDFKKHKDKDNIVFIISVNSDTANKIYKITKRLKTQPSKIIETVLNDYFNVEKLKNE